MSARRCAPASAEAYSLDRPEVVTELASVDGTRKWLLRMPPQEAGDKPHDIEMVYIPEADRGTLCLSSQVGCTMTCAFCHTGTQAGAQPDRGRDRRPDAGGARPARRLARRHPARRRHRADRRRPLRHQCGDDGHGRAAAQFRGGDARPRHGGRRRRPVARQAPHHAVHLRRGADDRRAPAPRSAACWRSRCTRCATSCATSWCR